MPFWWKRKRAAVELKVYSLPGDVGTISLPAFLHVDMENGDTLVAYRDEVLTLRVSSLSFSRPGQISEDAAKVYLRQQATERGMTYDETGANGVMSFEEQTEENGTPLVISYWYVGAKNTVLIISLTVLASESKTPSTREILDLIPRIIESVKITAVYKYLSVEDQEVVLTERIVDPVPQEITPFGDQQFAWLDEGRSSAHRLGLQYGSGGVLTPEELDVVLTRWLEDDESKEADDTVANALGIAFGDFLVENHQFQWVVVNDEFGTDCAVRHTRSEVMMFPTSSVTKRIESGESKCFVILLAMLQDVICRLS